MCVSDLGMTSKRAVWTGEEEKGGPRLTCGRGFVHLWLGESGQSTAHLT